MVVWGKNIYHWLTYWKISTLWVGRTLSPNTLCKHHDRHVQTCDSYKISNIIKLIKTDYNTYIHKHTHAMELERRIFVKNKGNNRQRNGNRNGQRAWIWSRYIILELKYQKLLFYIMITSLLKSFRRKERKKWLY